MSFDWELSVRKKECGDIEDKNYYTPNKHTNQLSSLGTTVDGNSFNSSSFFKLFYFSFIFSSFSPSLQIHQLSTHSELTHVYDLRDGIAIMICLMMILHYCILFVYFFPLLFVVVWCWRRMSCVIIRDLTNWRLNSTLLLLHFLQRWFSI